MKSVSKGLAVIAAVMTVAWLTGAVLAVSATQSASSSIAASTHSNRPVSSDLAVVVPHSAAAAFVQAPQAPAGATQMSEQVFKNVQVLKGIPVDEFMGTMGVFTAALSLCCGDCHTGAGTSNPKWEDDPPRKRTARAMMLMVQGINRTSFGGRQVVTCWTCHRGQKSPSVTPSLDFAYGEPVVVPPDMLSAAPSGVPTLDQIFNKYIQALGGAARVSALTSYAAKASSIPYGEFGNGDPAEIYARAPNQLAMTTHQREGDVVRTFDGANGWWQLPLTVTPQYALTGSLLEGARFDAAMAFPWRIRDFFTNWRVSFPTTIDGTEVDVVQGNTTTGMIGTLYFDKQSGLLKRMVRYAASPVGRIPTQIDYAEYRPVAGVMMPFKFSWAWVSSREEWTVSEYQPNASIDASRFTKPVTR
jgi:photosynthetic reaction center cytochrome c subunit